MTLAATVISISTVLCIFNDWSCTTTTSRHFALDSPFLCLSHDLHFHYIHVSTTLDFYNLFIVEVLHSSCINSNCSHYCSHHLAFEYSQIFLNLLSLLFLFEKVCTLCNFFCVIFLWFKTSLFQFNLILQFRSLNLSITSNFLLWWLYFRFCLVDSQALFLRFPNCFIILTFSSLPFVMNSTASTYATIWLLLLFKCPLFMF